MVMENKTDSKSRVEKEDFPIHLVGDLYLTATHSQYILVRQTASVGFVPLERFKDFEQLFGFAQEYRRRQLVCSLCDRGFVAGRSRSQSEFAEELSQVDLQVYLELDRLRRALCVSGEDLKQRFVPDEQS